MLSKLPQQKITWRKVTREKCPALLRLGSGWAAQHFTRQVGVVGIQEPRQEVCKSHEARTSGADTKGKRQEGEPTWKRRTQDSKTGQGSGAEQPGRQRTAFQIALVYGFRNRAVEQFWQRPSGLPLTGCPSQICNIQTAICLEGFSFDPSFTPHHKVKAWTPRFAELPALLEVNQLPHHYLRWLRYSLLWI